jgi:N-ethylmaleimide reductase
MAAMRGGPPAPGPAASHFVLRRNTGFCFMSNDNAAAELFQPIRMGALALPNRVVMAPLTRSRAGTGDAPGPLNATYYAQRASAGLIISEATNITQQGKGYAFTPGIWSDEQVAGWRLVTDAVHARNGRIVCQLWHVGRISHPSLQPNGALPVAPSAVQPKGNAFTETGFQPHVAPRALETDEIAGIVSDYRHAAEQAKRAGFDGVEVHAANGYLIDQFLRDGTNKRTDRYGGSVENRLRFLLEVTEAVTAVWGGERTGLRLSPVSPANDISDSDPMAVFGPAVEAVNRFDLAYVHFVEGATGGDRNVAPDFDFAKLRRAFHGLTMMNNGYDRDLAVAAVREGRADLVAFGRPYIANPDLVERLRRGAPLAKPDNATFYGGDAHGYTDYPALGEEQLNAA